LTLCEKFQIITFGIFLVGARLRVALDICAMTLVSSRLLERRASPTSIR
jgi:hypothetical protein